MLFLPKPIIGSFHSLLLHCYFSIVRLASHLTAILAHKFNKNPVYFPFSLVPSAWPSRFFGINISAYDLLLNWSRIPYDDWRGFLLGYTILYRETDAVGSPWNTSKVYGGNTLSSVIRNLNAYTNHTLRIACFTIKGNGNFSDDIVISTGEDGRHTTNIIYIILL